MGTGVTADHDGHESSAARAGGSSSSMRLLLKSSAMTGGEGAVEGVDPKATVRALKGMFVDVGAVDLRPEDMRLLYNGRRLRNDDAICEVGIKDGDCIVVIKGRADSGAMTESNPIARAPGRQEIIDAVAAVLEEAGKRRTEEGSEDEEMPDAEARPETGAIGSADLFNALQASAITGGVEGLEEQLHNILNVLARFDGRSGGDLDTGRSSHDGDEDEDEEMAGGESGSGGGADLRGGLAAAEHFFRPPDPNPECVEQLKDMGFPEPRVRKALVICRNSVARATDWLLEHADDADIDTELTEAELRQIARNSFLTAQRLSRRFPNTIM